MTHETGGDAGWLITGFQYSVVLWVWVAAVVLYGLWRSVAKPDPDPIRPAGPTGL